MDMFWMNEEYSLFQMNVHFLSVFALHLTWPQVAWVVIGQILLQNGINPGVGALYLYYTPQTKREDRQLTLIYR